MERITKKTKRKIDAAEGEDCLGGAATVIDGSEPSPRYEVHPSQI
jgi:hypothetical protein